MTIDVKDAGGNTVTIPTPNANGRAAAAAAKPVALSNEDLAVVQAIATALGSALPLPTGAATQTTLSAILTALGSALPLPTGAATQTTLAAILTALGSALPLPTGAATQTTLAAVLTALQTAIPAGANLIGAVASPAPVTLTVSITRPADTNAYVVGDAYADSTSAPTASGFLFTGAARAAGKSVILSDLVVTSSNPAATPLQGEVWIFDAAVTAVNDNAAFGVSDAEVLTLVAKVPFFMTTGTNNNSAHVQGINALITTVSNANLRFLVRVTNAYTPANAEVLTFRAKFLPVD